MGAPCYQPSTIMTPALTPTFRRIFKLEAGDYPRATPPQNAKATDSDVFQWLLGQSDDLMDACLAQLPARDRAILGQGLIMPGPHRGLAAPQPMPHLVRRVAACNRQAVLQGIDVGPLRTALLGGLDTPHNQAVDSTHWVRLNGMRNQQRDHVMGCAQSWALQWPNAARQPLYQDVAAAVCALDRLSLAAPHTLAWHLTSKGHTSAAHYRKTRREAGREALLMASWFTTAMQHTPLAHVVLGSALAFMGRTEAAEEIFTAWAKRDMAQALCSGADALHLSQLFLDPHRLPDRCLMWVKAAALAADAPAICKIYFDALHRVHRIHNRWPSPSDLNARWPILDGSQALGLDPDLEWAQFMGQGHMTQYIISHTAAVLLP